MPQFALRHCLVMKDAATEDPSTEFYSWIRANGIKFLNFGIGEITAPWDPEIERNVIGALQVGPDPVLSRIVSGIWIRKLNLRTGIS
ncbi:hypothetical protein TWF106_000508 [Orbilia oligospora]|uniref:Uncharacterized protein n=1 Tax=Orbilia oligospora TaxID=2813651 RepID=A0A6G1MHQ7_ORBOL|nr:hypothetical protein TWF788_001350 [Orbilia oligospora]KAF3207081.1 hypothetical protein TWF106_000508 [Orbilia oligospora]KAF3207082.1 hypothetical protein TWF106_000508 [Orbilia oligospora]KAF3257620.1 hypothetical protein TWF192_000912 [Orbilia oligospora]KAF3257621.1 hypothetical protein TWF192_000912 [Orbilia oligospora]